MSKTPLIPRLRKTAFSMLALTLAVGVGCAYRTPVALAPSLGPISTPYRETGDVEVELCRPMLFGFVPLRAKYGMQDLVAAAKDTADGVIRVSVDQLTMFWLIGYTTCHELHGTKVQFDRGSGPSDAGHLGGQSVSITPAVMFQTTDTIYARLGREKPVDDAEYARDVQVVSDYIQRGFYPSDLVVAAARGVGVVGDSATIDEILAAGVTEPP